MADVKFTKVSYQTKLQESHEQFKAKGELQRFGRFGGHFSGQYD